VVLGSIHSLSVIKSWFGSGGRGTLLCRRECDQSQADHDEDCHAYQFSM
jgi:hypothetical protein